MRKLLFGVAALLCLSGTSAQSYTLENIAKQCHPWSELNFSPDVDTDMLAAVGACIGFFGAFKDAGAANCAIQKQVPDLKFAAFGFHNNYSVEQLIQFTLNFKRDNPDNWDDNVALLYLDILPNARCD